MTASTFIARLLGPVLVIIGLGLLVEGETFRAMAGEFLRSPALVYFSGLATLAVGLAILNVHHQWTRDWRTIVTVFGWLSVIGGIFRILAPNAVQRVGESVIAHHRWPAIGAIVTLALGAFLSMMGYRDVWQGAPRRTRHRSTASRSSGAASRSGKPPRRKARGTRQPGAR
jgi:uncharacterized protein YjeT (DUF2065 family)